MKFFPFLAATAAFFHSPGHLEFHDATFQRDFGPWSKGYKAETLSLSLEEGFLREYRQQPSLTDLNVVETVLVRVVTVECTFCETGG